MPAFAQWLLRGAAVRGKVSQHETGLRKLLLHCAVVNRLGDSPEVSRAAAPRPGAGEALVAVDAAALNFADLLMIRGTYQHRADPPFTLGMEFAGTVAALGPDAAGPPPGTRVAVYAGRGGLAGYAVARAADCLPVPAGLDIARAAAVPVAYGTADLALRHRARLRAGETLIVSGAAGGVGRAAVELGARTGARVIALARGAEKCAVARAAGAADTVDLREVPPEGLRDALAALGGADVLYDTVGGAVFEQAVRCLRPGGRAVLVGFASGEVPSLRANHLLVKNVDVLGYWWGDYARFDPETMRASLRRCLDAAAAGDLSPRIGLRLPLARAVEGLEALRARRTTGKVVIDVTEADRA